MRCKEWAHENATELDGPADSHIYDFYKCGMSDCAKFNVSEITLLCPVQSAKTAKSTKNQSITLVLAYFKSRNMCIYF